MTKPPDTPQVIFFGQAILSWKEEEQKTGRYGSVGLFADAQLEHALPLPRAADMIGYWGKLRTVVIRNRVRKFHPGSSAPEGAIVELGVGTIHMDDRYNVGVRPIPLQELHWLDPAKLSLVAEQEVRLEFSLYDFLFEPTR